MKLLGPLFKFHKEFLGTKPTIKGACFIGKYRYVPKVTRGMRAEVWKRLLVEEQNMLCLSYPYISKEQEDAYLKSIGRTRPELWDDWMRKEFVHPKPNSFIADYLVDLERGRKFENEN